MLDSVPKLAMPLLAPCLSALCAFAIRLFRQSSSFYPFRAISMFLSHNHLICSPHFCLLPLLPFSPFYFVFKPLLTFPSSYYLFVTLLFFPLHYTIWILLLLSSLLPYLFYYKTILDFSINMSSFLASDYKMKRKNVPVRSPTRDDIITIPGVIFSFPSAISAIRETISWAPTDNSPKPSSYTKNELRKPRKPLSFETSSLFDSYYCKNTYYSFSSSKPADSLPTATKRKFKTKDTSLTSVPLVSHKRAGSESGLIDFKGYEKKSRVGKTVSQYNPKFASSPVRSESNFTSTPPTTFADDQIASYNSKPARAVDPNYENMACNDSPKQSHAQLRPYSSTIQYTPPYAENNHSNTILSSNQYSTHYQNAAYDYKGADLGSIVSPPQNIARSQYHNPSISLFKALDLHTNGEVMNNCNIIKKEHKHKKSETIKKKSAKTPKKTATLNRVCASCKVNSTPCWRPGWDSLMSLCNSCGLRYKKGGIFCKNCSYVPMKTEIISSSSIPCKNCKHQIQIKN
ncbi:hypothetical protein BB561_000073 [Smittium simulii]|uniref:GATA-type domain-containing protein n=1 Tax=Smittium simulii TaxID=133385 RepID=A0A2T9Z0T8_9FUNG|nr:hypothetical protein BB561_000073 [Smittium simulii]